jgi:integrase
MGKLTVRGVAALDKPGRHADGGGLYLNVAKGGSKSWVLLFQRDGRRREIGLGSVKRVTLAEARVKAAEMRREAPRQPVTFGEAADAFLADVGEGWRSTRHRDQWKTTLHTHAAPLRPKPVAEIDTDAVLAVLKPLWQRIPETASRTRGRIEVVLDSAKARGWRTGENPARWRGHLALILPKPDKLKRGHHRALPFPELPAFMAALRERRGIAAPALEFLILTAARTGEVAGMRWEEVDLKAALWTVPKERMKAGREHRVPLSPRAVALLGEPSDGLVWPGLKEGKSFSTASLERVLDRLKVKATVHGFRSTFRDWVGDCTSFPREVAEAALAHVVENATERAYRRGDALDKRRQLMQAWADFCESSQSA